MFSRKSGIIVIESFLDLCTGFYWIYGFQLLVNQRYSWVAVWVICSLIISSSVKKDAEFVLNELKGVKN